MVGVGFVEGTGSFVYKTTRNLATQGALRPDKTGKMTVKYNDRYRSSRM